MTVIYGDGFEMWGQRPGMSTTPNWYRGARWTDEEIAKLIGPRSVVVGDNIVLMGRQCGKSIAARNRINPVVGAMLQSMEEEKPMPPTANLKIGDHVNVTDETVTEDTREMVVAYAGAEDLRGRTKAAMEHEFPEIWIRADGAIRFDQEWVGDGSFFWSPDRPDELRLRSVDLALDELAALTDYVSAWAYELRPATLDELVK